MVQLVTTPVNIRTGLSNRLTPIIISITTRNTLNLVHDNRKLFHQNLGTLGCILSLILLVYITLNSVILFPYYMFKFKFGIHFFQTKFVKVSQMSFSKTEFINKILIINKRVIKYDIKFIFLSNILLNFLPKIQTHPQILYIPCIDSRSTPNSAIYTIRELIMIQKSYG